MNLYRNKFKGNYLFTQEILIKLVDFDNHYHTITKNRYQYQC